jgi:hypothetical protein
MRRFESMSVDGKWTADWQPLQVSDAKGGLVRKVGDSKLGHGSHGDSVREYPAVRTVQYEMTIAHLSQPSGAMTGGPQ